MIARPFPGLGSRQLLGPPLPASPGLPGGSILTHLARTALAQAYRALGVRSGDEVLIPALHCEVEADAARFAGARVRFYPVTRSLGIDAATLAERIGEATRVVTATHFFGLPQDLDIVAALCRARGVALLEDCAHVFIGAAQGAGCPGSLGRAAVYSLPKFLPVPDGGVLVLRDGWPSGVTPPLLDAPPKTPLARRTARLLLDRLDERRPTAAALLDRVLLEPLRWAAHRRTGGAESPPGGSARRYNPGSSVFDPCVAAAGASRWTRRILFRVDIEEISRKRRHNYDYLVSAIGGIGGVSVLAPELPVGAVPLVLPVRIGRGVDLADRLFVRGIGTYRFGARPSPEFPSHEFPEAGELREALLGLPVHQDLTDAQLDAIAAALERSAA